MVKLIKHTGECDYPDDPSLPFKLELVMRPPEFMIVAFVGLYGGTEEVVARGETQKELEVWMDANSLSQHPRLKRWSITDQEGNVVRSYDAMKPQAQEVLA